MKWFVHTWLIWMASLASAITAQELNHTLNDRHKEAITDLLHSVEINEANTYTIQSEAATLSTFLDLYTFYHSAINLRLAAISVDSSTIVQRLPEAVQTTFKTEFAHTYNHINEEILKIDRTLAYFWTRTFRQQSKFDYNLLTLPKFMIPQLYNRSININSAAYKIPPYAISLLKQTATPNTVSIALQTHIANVNAFTHMQRLQINNAFLNAYTPLKKTCHQDRAIIQPNLYLLYPTTESTDIITANLITSLGLLPGQNHDQCVLAAITYLKLLETDLTKIITGKLPDHDSQLTFKIPRSNPVQLVVPTKTQLSEQEYSKKLLSNYPAVRYTRNDRHKRNFFTDIIGAGSRTDQLQNTIDLKNIENMDRDLRVGQNKIQLEYDRLMGDRIKEESVLSDIGKHVNQLEVLAHGVNTELTNVTEATRQLTRTLEAFMTISTTWEMVAQEVQLLRTGLEHEVTKFKQLIQSQPGVILDTVNKIQRQINSPHIIKMTNRGVLFSSTMTLGAEEWAMLQIKSVPVMTTKGEQQLVFEDSIITNGQDKILSSDIIWCNHVTLECPQEVGIQKLSLCELHLLNQLTNLRLDKAHINYNGSSDIMKECATKLQPVVPSELSYIRSDNSLMIYLQTEVASYKICAGETSVVRLNKGLSRVSLPQGCIIKIKDTVLKGQRSNYRLSNGNYTFIEDRLQESINYILNNTYVPDKWLSILELHLPTNITEHIKTYLKEANHTTNPLTYDETLWGYSHPVHALVNIGPVILTSIIFLSLLISCCCCSCCKRALMKEVMNLPRSIAGQSANRDLDVTQTSMVTSTPVSATSNRRVAYCANNSSNEEAQVSFEQGHNTVPRSAIRRTGLPEIIPMENRPVSQHTLPRTTSIVSIG